MSDATVEIMGITWPDKVEADIACHLAVAVAKIDRAVAALWLQHRAATRAFGATDPGTMAADAAFADRLMIADEIHDLNSERDDMEWQWEQHCIRCGIDPYDADGAA